MIDNSIKLPSSWKHCKLGDVINYGTTLKVEPIEMQPESWLLELEDIEKDTSDLIARLTVSERKPKSTKNKFKQGQLLYGKLRPYLNKVIIADQDGYCSTEIVPLTKCDQLEERYIFYWLKSPAFLEYTDKVSHGTNMPRLGTKAGNEAPFIVAPLNEQYRIADKLDAAFDAIKACKKKLNNAAETIQRFRQSVLAAAVSGELTKEWREEMGISKDSWQQLKLRDIGEFGRGKSKHRPRNDPRLFGGDYPFIQTGEVANSEGLITEHKKTLSEFGLKQSKLWPAGTLCITIAANIADTAILSYPACFPDSVVGFITDHQKARTKYVKWLIESIAGDLERFAPATAQKNINLNILDDIRLSIPTPEEQDMALTKGEEFLEYAKEIESNILNALNQTSLMQKSLLCKAFRGELVPQDPNDEPASVLLERIKVQRKAEAAAKKSAKRGRKKKADPAQLVIPEGIANNHLAKVLEECGALSQRALLAASELEPGVFQLQLTKELKAGGLKQVDVDGEAAYADAAWEEEK